MTTLRQVHTKTMRNKRTNIKTGKAIMEARSTLKVNMTTSMRAINMRASKINTINMNKITLCRKTTLEAKRTLSTINTTKIKNTIANMRISITILKNLIANLIFNKASISKARNIMTKEQETNISTRINTNFKEIQEIKKPNTTTNIRLRDSQTITRTKMFPNRIKNHNKGSTSHKQKALTNLRNADKRNILELFRR